MSEADSLRMVAEVVDRFSGPLRNLRNQLQGIRAGDGLRQVETAAVGAERAVVNAGKSIASSLTPALAAVGIGGFGAAAAMAAVGMALRGFTGDTANLSRLGREVGMTADQLRSFQALGGKFGLSADQMSAGARGFAENMRDLRKGVGDTVGFLLGQGGATAKFAQELRGTASNAEALDKALDFLTRIPDPVERSRVAEKLGLGRELGIMGAEGLAKLRQLRQEIADELGKLPADAGKNAEALERAFGTVGTVLRGIRDAVGADLAPQITAAAAALGEFFKENRENVAKGLSTALTSVGEALRAIPWSEIGKNVGDFFRTVEEQGGKALSVVREVATFLKSISEGRWSDAIGALRRLDRATDMGMAGAGPGKAVQDSMRADTGPLIERQDQIRRQIDVLDGLIASKRSSGDESGASASEAKREGLRRENDALQEEIKRLRSAPAEQPRGGATAQKMSLESAGDDLRSMIHKAAATDGGSGLRPSGDRDDDRRTGLERMLTGMRDLGEEMRKLREVFEPLTQDATGAGAGLAGAITGGGGLAGMIQRASIGGGIPRLPVTRGGGYEGGPRTSRLPADNDNDYAVRPRSGGPLERTREGMRSLFGSTAGGAEGANPGAYKDVLDHIARSEGTAKSPGGGYNTSLAHGRFLPGGQEQNLVGKTLNEIDALQTQMLKNPANRWNSSAIGRYQIVRTTLRGLRKKFGLSGDDVFDERMQDRLGAELARARGPNAAGLAAEWESLRGDKLAKAVELMRKIDPAAGTLPSARQTAESVRGGWPSAWRGGSPPSADLPDWAKGEASKFGAFKNSSAAMMEKAREAGVSGAAPTVNAPVNVSIEKPGPDTKVRTQSDGPLFREVSLQRGRSMSMAQVA